MIDGTMSVAFLPYLREFKQGVPDPEPCTYRKIPEIKPLYNNVLSERAKIDIGTSFSECFDLLQSKQAHLPVPFACMGISLTNRN